MRRLALLALASGCSPLALPPFELDVSSNCNEVAVDPIWEELDDRDEEDWLRVIAAAADAPDVDAAWLLVVRRRDTGESGLSIVHFADDEVVLVDDLDTPTADADDLRLVPGPDRGQMWLVERSTAIFRMRRYASEPEPTLITVSSNYGVQFPSVQCVDEDGNVMPCATEDWPRELVFFDGTPYLLTLPPASGDASVDIIVGRPDPGLDYLETQETLNFAPDCDPSLEPEELAACEAMKASMTHPKVAMIGIQADARVATTSLALYRETVSMLLGGPMVFDSDVAFVTLGHDKLGHPAGNLVSEPALLGPESERRGGVAIDSRAMYVQYEPDVAVDQEDPGSMLVQKAALDDEFDILSDELRVEDDHRFLQLDEDLALGRIVDGQWEIVKLFPDAPGESTTTMHDPGSTLDEVASAGPGTFLLHESDGGPDLVRVRCTDDPPESP